MADNLLEVQDLAISYGAARVIEGLTLSVPAGSAFALLGPNGAGKSSLAKAIVGLAPIERGDVRLRGSSLKGLATHKITRLGVALLPEGRGIFPGLSVEDNLRMLLRRSQLSEKECLARAFELYPILGQRRRQRAGTLSGGEQQMLALARVLVAPPPLVIADEPSLGLAPLIVKDVFAALRRAREMGVTLLLIEEHVDQALTLCDTVAFMRRGRIVWQGPAADANQAVRSAYL